MGWNEWLGIVGVNAADLAPDLVLNDYQLSMQAALAGEGVALGWAFTCQLLLRNKILIRPVDDEVRTGNAFFVVANEKSTKLDEIMPLVEWIVSEAKRV